MNSPFKLDELMTPETAIRKWPALSLNWLREAITRQDIASVKVGRRKLITQASIEEYLAQNVQEKDPCKTDYSNLTDNGSPENQPEIPITGSGMTKDAEELGEQALRRQISKTPSEN